MGHLDHCHYSECNRVLVLSGGVKPNAELAEAMERNAWALQTVRGRGDALRQVALNEPAVVVVYLDGDDPATSVISLIAELRRRRPRLPVIALVERDDEDSERRLRAAGATAYIATATGAEQLI